MTDQPLSLVPEATTGDTGDFLYAVIGGSSRRIAFGRVGRLFQTARIEDTNGDITLQSTDTWVILKPPVPSVRTITIKADTPVPLIICDGNGDWESFNVTFAIEGGGLINGLATGGVVGATNWGSFEFRPLGNGNFTVR